MRKPATKLRPILRYPGSKAKLVASIRKHLPIEMGYLMTPQRNHWTYIEPFVGAGAIAGDMLPDIRDGTRVVLNDKDFWLVCLWNAIKSDPNYLCAKITSFIPSAEYFYQFKEQDGSSIDPSEAGFRKLVLHYTSFSGLGVKAGGPLGGRDEDNDKYNPACRWRPERMRQNIRNWCDRFSKLNVKITNRDFSVSLLTATPNSYVYLDPPYYEKGEQLYKHNMTPDDHTRLATILRSAKFRWTLSYDDHPEIRRLYSWACIKEVPLTYTISTSRTKTRRKNHEVLITAKESA